MEYIENYEEFFKLLKNYTNVFYKNMLTKYLNNPNYLEMLYVKGLFLLKNIFILLFFYCENINEVLLTSEKAYIYYIEFLIQINLNAMNLELTFRDAVLFTYKKTLLSYKKQNNTNTIKEKINKDLDTNLNILCNIFYLIDNRNFIEYDESITTSTNDYINAFVITKINNIKQLEKKIKHYLITNINLSELNNILLSLRDSVEKKIIINLNNKSNNKLNDKLNDKLNNKIYYLLDNYKANNLLTNITSFDE
jgi:hypothetical protein